MVATLLVAMVLSSVNDSFAGGPGSGRRKKYTYSRSYKRISGFTSIKRKIAKVTGIPTTAQGRKAKVARMFRIK